MEVVISGSYRISYNIGTDRYKEKSSSLEASGDCNFPCFVVRKFNSE